MGVLRPLPQLLIAALAIAGVLSSSCDFGEDAPQRTELSPGGTGFDSVLARKYGADEYGMKKYVMAFLRRGPNRDLSGEETAELQRAHLENIQRLADSGSLVLAGPFLGDGELRGIYIFDVRSMKEAEKLTATDPAIKAGSLAMELREWYGPAALVAVNGLHEKLSRNSIAE